jgi:hypothetical protein
MIDELRQRLITCLPVTDPWVIEALHDHDVETCIDFPDEISVDIEISLVFLPPHSSDQMQALDVGLFGIHK